jgi:hypothetical protein
VRAVAARRRRFRAASVGRVVLLDVHVEAHEQKHITNYDNAERVSDVAARETRHGSSATSKKNVKV